MSEPIRSIRRLLVLTMAVIAMVAAACGDPQAAPQIGPPSPDVGQDDPAMRLTQRCENPSDGFAIRYPQGWRTNLDPETITCRAFDPQPIDADPGTEFDLGTAVVASSNPTVTLDEIARQDALPAIEVRARERTEVAGHDAVLLEAVGTGAGMVPDGVELRSYHVDLDGRTVSLSTYGVGTPDLETTGRVLDAMAETIEPIPATSRSGDPGNS